MSSQPTRHHVTSYVTSRKTVRRAAACCADDDVESPAIQDRASPDAKLRMMCRPIRPSLLTALRRGVETNP